jgi:hypothetical protein
LDVLNYVPKRKAAAQPVTAAIPDSATLMAVQKAALAFSVADSCPAFRSAAVQPISTICGSTGSMGTPVGQSFGQSGSGTIKLDRHQRRAAHIPTTRAARAEARLSQVTFRLYRSRVFRSRRPAKPLFQQFARMSEYESGGADESYSAFRYTRPRISTFSITQTMAELVSFLFVSGYQLKGINKQVESDNKSHCKIEIEERGNQ